MRTSLHTKAHRAGGRTLVAASLAGVMAVTGTATASLAQADANDPIAPAADAATTAPEAPTALASEVDAQHEAVAETQAKAAVFAGKVAAVRKLRSKVVDIAKDQIGDRYRRGSSGPNAFDCSGLVAYVYRKAMGKELPHQSHSQYGAVKKIKEKDARPGDLVFFFRHGAHHVGVYIGGGKMVHAVGVGSSVKVNAVHGDWFSRTLTGFGRVIAEPAAA